MSNSKQFPSGFAGKWIAKLKGKIVGQGGSPKQAFRSAQRSRHKEIPEISYIPMKNELTFSPLIKQIADLLPRIKEIYLVGGAVRDSILQIKSKDLDFTLKGDALRIARKVANSLNGSYYRMDDEHQTGRVILIEDDGSRTIMDFSKFRGDDVEADLNKRDFTINSMAINIHSPNELIDPLGGLADLQGKRLKMCSTNSFTDDPVRIYRAIRMAARYQLKIESDTKTTLKAAINLLDKPSIERLRDELFKILESPKPATSLIALDMLKALEFTLPEISQLKNVEAEYPHTMNGWDHSLQTIRTLEEILILLDVGFMPDNESGGNLISGLISHQFGRYRKNFNQHFSTTLSTERSILSLINFSALYHDIAKIELENITEDGKTRYPGHEETGASITKKRAQELRLSNSEAQRIWSIVHHHGRIRPFSREDRIPTALDAYRFFLSADESGVDVILLSIADLIATYGSALPQDKIGAHIAVCRVLLEYYWETPEKINPPEIINGRVLMRKLRLTPGPLIGKLLSAIREAQVLEEISTEKDALKFSKAYIEDIT